MHESIRHLKLDWRLLRRRGWLSDEEFERELAQLPDTADTGVPLGEEEEAPEEEPSG